MTSSEFIGLDETLGRSPIIAGSWREHPHAVPARPRGQEPCGGAVPFPPVVHGIWSSIHPTPDHSSSETSLRL